MPRERVRRRKLTGHARPPAWAARGVFPAPAGDREGGGCPKCRSAAGGAGGHPRRHCARKPGVALGRSGRGGREGASGWRRACREVPTRNCPRGALALGRWPVPQNPPVPWSRATASAGRGSPFPLQKLFSGPFSLASPYCPAGTSPGRPPSPGADNGAGTVALPGTLLSVPAALSRGPPRSQRPRRSPILEGSQSLPRGSQSHPVRVPQGSTEHPHRRDARRHGELPGCLS